jgi:TonB family protein
MRAAGLLLLLSVTVLGCSERARQARQGTDGWLGSASIPAMPDERPQMLNDELPFRYPVPQYLARVQGNVMLRLFLDASGRVVSDSTRVVEASGHDALDSAALAGASQLRFRPARLRGTAIPVSLLFPVHFRHPGGTPLRGDSL